MESLCKWLPTHPLQYDVILAPPIIPVSRYGFLNVHHQWHIAKVVMKLAKSCQSSVILVLIRSTFLLVQTGNSYGSWNMPEKRVKGHHLTYFTLYLQCYLSDCPSQDSLGKTQQKLHPKLLNCLRVGLITTSMTPSLMRPICSQAYLLELCMGTGMWLVVW